MQHLRQFLRDGVAGASLRAGPRHLDQVVRELELASPGAPLASDGDAARHHLARVRPEAISLPSSGSPEVDVRAAQRFVSADKVVGHVDAFLRCDGSKYVFDRILVNALKFNGLA